MTRNDTINNKHKTSMSVGRDGEMVVFYYKTAIVLVDKDKIVLNTGGWHTATTRARMNFVSQELKLGYRVYQKQNQMFVDYAGQTHEFEKDKIQLNRRTEESISV